MRTSKAYFSVRGLAWKRSWHFLSPWAREPYAFRQTVDQHWSPYYTERTTTVGLGWRRSLAKDFTIGVSWKRDIFKIRAR